MLGCINPTTIFEANHRRIVQSADEAREVIGNISKMLEQVGLETSPVGFYNYKQLIDATRNIKIDEQEIQKSIIAIRNSNWSLKYLLKPENTSFDYVFPDGYPTPLPLSVAEYFTPNIRLRYFNPWYVKLFLMHAIVKELYDSNEDVKPFRDFCRQEMDREYYSILNLRGDRLRGLGDIELFSSCELNRQSAVRSPHICMAISFDENLNNVLWGRMQTRGPSLVHAGGDDPNAFTSAWMYSMRHENKVLEKVNRRAREYYEALQDFGDKVLAPYFRFQNDSENDPSNSRNRTT